ncbi:MAG: AMP-binding protein, partial [Segetibacter sp.]
SHEQKKSLDEVVQVTKSDLQQLTIAALIIYLGKISSQSEIVFGIPVHKRGSGQLRNILGMFSGVLPFKGAFSEDMKLTDLLKEIASSRKQDYSHQNYLIIDLIRALKINASENFLFDIIINYVPFNFQLDFGKGVQPSIHWLQSEYEKLPLQICWRDYGNKQPLELAFHYSYEYFTSQEIELLAERIIFILQQFTSTLDTNIGKVDNLPCRERQLLKGFNGLAVSYPRDKSIVDLFEQQVERTPNNIAVVFERQKLSYRELNNRANRLGHFLRSKGVKEDVLVPICIARSVEMMVGILGILKAGGAYVPIDPDYPQDRISYMLQDAGASIILSSKEARSNLPLN